MADVSLQQLESSPLFAKLSYQNQLRMREMWAVGNPSKGVLGHLQMLPQWNALTPENRQKLYNQIVLERAPVFESQSYKQRAEILAYQQKQAEEAARPYMKADPTLYNRMRNKIPQTPAEQAVVNLSQTTGKINQELLPLSIVQGMKFLLRPAARIAERIVLGPVPSTYQQIYGKDAFKYRMYLQGLTKTGKATAMTGSVIGSALEWQALSSAGGIAFGVGKSMIPSAGVPNLASNLVKLAIEGTPLTRFAKPSLAVAGKLLTGAVAESAAAGASMAAVSLASDVMEDPEVRPNTEKMLRNAVIQFGIWGGVNLFTRTMVPLFMAAYAKGLGKAMVSPIRGKAKIPYTEPGTTPEQTKFVLKTLTSGMDIDPGLYGIQDPITVATMNHVRRVMWLLENAPKNPKPEHIAALQAAMQGYRLTVENGIYKAVLVEDPRKQITVGKLPKLIEFGNTLAVLPDTVISPDTVSNRQMIYDDLTIRMRNGDFEVPPGPYVKLRSRTMGEHGTEFYTLLGGRAQKQINQLPPKSQELVKSLLQGIISFWFLPDPKMKDYVSTPMLARAIWETANNPTIGGGIRQLEGDYTGLSMQDAHQVAKTLRSIGAMPFKGELVPETVYQTEGNILRHLWQVRVPDAEILSAFNSPIGVGEGNNALIADEVSFPMYQAGLPKEFEGKTPKAAIPPSERFLVKTSEADEIVRREAGKWMRLRTGENMGARGWHELAIRGKTPALFGPYIAASQDEGMPQALVSTFSTAPEGMFQHELSAMMNIPMDTMINAMDQARSQGHVDSVTVDNLMRAFRVLGSDVDWKELAGVAGPEVLGLAYSEQRQFYERGGRPLPEILGTRIHEWAHIVLRDLKGEMTPWPAITNKKGRGLGKDWKVVQDVLKEKWSGNWGYYTRQTERYARLMVAYFLHNSKLKTGSPMLYARAEELLIKAANNVDTITDLGEEIAVENLKRQGYDSFWHTIPDKDGKPIKVLGLTRADQIRIINDAVDVYSENWKVAKTGEPTSSVMPTHRAFMYAQLSGTLGKESKWQPAVALRMAFGKGSAPEVESSRMQAFAMSWMEGLGVPRETAVQALKEVSFHIEGKSTEPKKIQVKLPSRVVTDEEKTAVLMDVIQAARNALAKKPYSVTVMEAAKDVRVVMDRFLEQSKVMNQAFTSWLANKAFGGTVGKMGERWVVDGANGLHKEFPTKAAMDLFVVKRTMTPDLLEQVLSDEYGLVTKVDQDTGVIHVYRPWPKGGLEELVHSDDIMAIQDYLEEKLDFVPKLSPGYGPKNILLVPHGDNMEAVWTEDMTYIVSDRVAAWNIAKKFAGMFAGKKRVAGETTELKVGRGKIVIDNVKQKYVVEYPDAGFWKEFPSRKAAFQFLKQEAETLDGFTKMAEEHGYRTMVKDGWILMWSSGDVQPIAVKTIEEGKARLKSDPMPKFFVEETTLEGLTNPAWESIPSNIGPVDPLENYPKQVGEFRKAMLILNYIFAPAEAAFRTWGENTGDYSYYHMFDRLQTAFYKFVRAEGYKFRRGISTATSYNGKPLSKKKMEAVMQYLSAGAGNPKPEEVQAAKDRVAALYKMDDRDLAVADQTKTFVQLLGEYGGVPMETIIFEYAPKIVQKIMSTPRGEEGNIDFDEIIPPQLPGPLRQFFRNPRMNNEMLNLSVKRIDDALAVYTDVMLRGMYIDPIIKDIKKELRTKNKEEMRSMPARRLMSCIRLMTGLPTGLGEATMKQAARHMDRFIGGNVFTQNISAMARRWYVLGYDAMMGFRIWFNARNLMQNYQLQLPRGWALSEINEAHIQAADRLKERVEGMIHRGLATEEIPLPGMEAGAVTGGTTFIGTVIDKITELALGGMETTDLICRLVSLLTVENTFNKHLPMLASGEINYEQFENLTHLSSYSPVVRQQVKEYLSKKNVPAATQYYSMKVIDEANFPYKRGTNSLWMDVGWIGKLFGRFGVYPTWLVQNLRDSWKYAPNKGMALLNIGRWMAFMTAAYLALREARVDARDFLFWGNLWHSGSPQFWFMLNFLQAFGKGYKARVARAELKMDFSRLFVPGWMAFKGMVDAKKLFDEEDYVGAFIRLMNAPLIPLDGKGSSRELGGAVWK